MWNRIATTRVDLALDTTFGLELKRVSEDLRYRLNQIAAGLFLMIAFAASDPAMAVELRAIADVASVDSYRTHSFMRFGDEPPAQHVEVSGVFAKSPEAHDIQVSVTEGRRKPWIYYLRRENGVLYSGSGTRWNEIDKFDLTELSIVEPEDLLEIGPKLDEVATEELDGRKVIHLRGNKEDLPDIGGSSDAIEFSRTDKATVDLWVDAEEFFVVKMQIDAEVKQGSDVLNVAFGYEASDFNDVPAIEPIAPDQLEGGSPK